MLVFWGKLAHNTRMNEEKTVAYIVIDKDDAGLPVIEKWDIKQHYKYTPMGCVKA